MSTDPTLPMPGGSDPFPPPAPQPAPPGPFPPPVSQPVPFPPPVSQPMPPGSQYPPGPGPLVPGGGPVLVQIGEIAVTASTVRTPSGEFPLAGSTWYVADQWRSEQRTPQWAIIAAIVGFCVLTVLSLLFLLVKETVHRGTVQVTVTNGPWQYVAWIPVTQQYEVQQIHQRVNYARSLAVA